MIVSGVLFGYFAGLTYWFPKIFGITLDEKLGKWAFWSWLVGFILAFGPLYILGFMGATRRLDHYTALAWQPLFIVAAIGSMIIAIGFILQIIQLVHSIRTRSDRRATSDPWNGRTLEWSIPSPAPFYNFAVLPSVSARDAFWVQKQERLSPSTDYQDVILPKNTSAGMIIAFFVLSFGFGVVWHIWWLAILGLLCALIAVMIRLFTEHTEYMLTAAEIEAQDQPHLSPASSYTHYI